MSGLIKVEVSQIQNKIVPVLKSHEQIAGAYLFGSTLESCRLDSDIDIGLIMMPAYNISEKEFELIEARILKDLSPLATHHFDLVFLTRQDVFLSHKAIKYGKLIYVRDMDVITDFTEAVSIKYREEYPRYRQALETIALGDSK